MPYAINHTGASQCIANCSNISSDEGYASSHATASDDDTKSLSEITDEKSDERTKEFIAKGRELVKNYWQKERKMKSVLESGWQDPIADYTGPTLTIYNENCIEALEGYVIACTEESELKRIRSLVEAMMQRGTRRKLKLISTCWKQQLQQLEDEHPNFSEVIDYLRSGFALASVTDQVLKIDPLLFAGDPGVGKSMFASRFAELLSSSVTYIRMETAQSSGSIVGSESFWSNAKHGKILESLVFGENANPVFYLDELDKVCADRYDPAAALYALLEPGTAKKFSDLCYPFLMLDASRIVWVATCNNPEGVPAPLRSRFKIFTITPLDESQSLTVAKNIASNVIQEYSLSQPLVVFSDAAINALRFYSPRKMQQVAREAMGKAIYDGRRIVDASDVTKFNAATRGIGFL